MAKTAQSKPTQRTRTRTHHNQPYAHTSSAVQLQPKPKPKPKQRATPKQTAQKRPARKPKTLYKIVGRTKMHMTTCLAISLCLVFACAFGSVLSGATLFHKQDVIATAKTNLKDLREQNNITQANNAKNIDLVAIEKIATTKLGMAKAKPHQIKHIVVPKQSYVMQFKAGEEETGGLLEAAKSLFAK